MRNFCTLIDMTLTVVCSVIVGAIPSVAIIIVIFVRIDLKRLKWEFMNLKIVISIEKVYFLESIRTDINEKIIEI